MTLKCALSTHTCGGVYVYTRVLQVTRLGQLKMTSYKMLLVD